MARWGAASGLSGAHSTFDGVLLCVEPEDYWLWARKPGAPPAEVVNPFRQFCYDADGGWCREQRAAGRCHLTNEQFESVLRQQGDDEEVDSVTISNNGHKAPSWQVWSGITQEKTITIERTGRIRVSLAADHALGKPAVVQLLYSPSPRMIGIRVAPEGGQGVIRPKRKDDSNGLGFVFNARPFLDYHAIDYTATKRWAVTEINGVLAVDLDGKSLVSRGRKAA